ncbi:MAG: hypothetical protein R3F11_19915 [Verrucomicrobiales bacterium]
MLPALESAFAENFARRGEVGAAVSWKNGAEMTSLAGGFIDCSKTQRWEPDTLVPVWSATKDRGEPRFCSPCTRRECFPISPSPRF